MQLTYQDATNPTPVDWLYPDLIAKAAQTTIYGKPGIGKSLLALDLAIKISHQYPVLYLDYEMSTGDVIRRLDNMRQTEALKNGLFYNIYTGSDLPPLDTPEATDAIGGMLKTTGAKVLFIDSLSGAVQGGENDNDTYRNLTTHTITMLREYGITTIRIDHLSIKADQHAGPRGASRKIDDVDVAWEFQPVGTADHFTLKNRKNRIGEAPMQIPVKRVNSPLEFIVGTEFTLETLTEREILALSTINAMSVPLRTGRDGIRFELERTGFGPISNESLAKVVRLRKTSPPDRSPDSDRTVQMPMLDRSPPLLTGGDTVHGSNTDDVGASEDEHTPPTEVPY